MRDKANTAILVCILVAFASAVVALGFTQSLNRFIGGILLACGLFAFSLARNVSEGAKADIRFLSLGTRKESSLRPTTVKLWAVGVGLIGLLMLFGF